jgi:hypothetical protein
MRPNPDLKVRRPVDAAEEVAIAHTLLRSYYPALEFKNIKSFIEGRGRVHFRIHPNPDPQRVETLKMKNVRAPEFPNVYWRFAVELLDLNILEGLGVIKSQDFLRRVREACTCSQDAFSEIPEYTAVEIEVEGPVLAANEPSVELGEDAVLFHQQKPALQSQYQHEHIKEEDIQAAVDAYFNSFQHFDAIMDFESPSYFGEQLKAFGNEKFIQIMSSFQTQHGIESKNQPIMSYLGKQLSREWVGAKAEAKTAEEIFRFNMDCFQAALLSKMSRSGGRPENMNAVIEEAEAGVTELGVSYRSFFSRIYNTSLNDAQIKSINLCSKALALKRLFEDTVQSELDAMSGFISPATLESVFFKTEPTIHVRFRTVPNTFQRFLCQELQNAKKDFRDELELSLTAIQFLTETYAREMEKFLMNKIRSTQSLLDLHKNLTAQICSKYKSLSFQFPNETRKLMTELEERKVGLLKENKKRITAAAKI